MTLLSSGVISFIKENKDNYIFYAIIAACVLLVCALILFIFVRKRKIIFMANNKEIARGKYKINQKITIPAEASNYQWFEDEKLTKEFTQKKMKFSSKTIYGKEIIEKKETFLEKEIIDEDKKSIKVRVGSLSQRYIDKLNKLDEQQKADYVELKNEVLSYRALQNSITKDGDNFIFKNKTRVKINVLNGVLKVFVDIEREKIDGRFKRIDESKFKKYSSVPLEFTIDRPVEVRKAKNTISRLAKGLNLEKQEIVNRSFKKLTLQ